MIILLPIVYLNTIFIILLLTSLFYSLERFPIKNAMFFSAKATLFFSKSIVCFVLQSFYVGKTLEMLKEGDKKNLFSLADSF